MGCLGLCFRLFISRFSYKGLLLSPGFRISVVLLSPGFRISAGTSLHCSVLVQRERHWAGGWNLIICRVPSNPNHSVRTQPCTEPDFANAPV